MPTAIFVDADFFLNRFGQVYDKDRNDPAVVAKTLHEMALDHLTQPGDAERRSLYRIFVYDCPPLAKKAELPISGLPIDFAKTDSAAFRLQFHNELKCLRKVALRLGRLQEVSYPRFPRVGWRMRWFAMDSLLDGERTVDSLTDADFDYDVQKKGVDMKIGLDIASVAYKKQADQIVLVSNDADFVPAAKLARREGIDFILDPMWSKIASELHEHIDGLRSTCPRPIKKSFLKIGKAPEALATVGSAAPAAEPLRPEPVPGEKSERPQLKIIGTDRAEPQ
jgi:uncharacterized LabA/DUF88 family protein